MLSEILNRQTKNNPVFIGESGVVGKNSCCEGLAAQKIVDGDGRTHIRKLPRPAGCSLLNKYLVFIMYMSLYIN